MVDGECCDQDECSETDTCMENSFCVNQCSGYSCECNKGYLLNSESGLVLKKNQD